MRPPRFFVGGCLLFWGWQTGFWEAAALMAATVESAGVVRRRWDLTLSDFNRISDACTTVFIGMVLWLLATEAAARIVFIAIQWLPMAYFPLLLVQIYSTGAGVDLRALSLIFRKGHKDQDRSVIIDLTYPYGILCILSAGAANVRNPGYYLAALLLAAVGLLPSRSRRFSPFVWGAAVLTAGAVGWCGQAGLQRLQGMIEEKGLAWFAHLQVETDPFRAVTAIGEVGALKPSDRIRFRVEGPDPGGDPLLLRETSYNTYRLSRWYAIKPRFAPVRPLGGGDWSLGPSRSPARTATVIAPLRRGEGLLPLPSGTFRITNLPVDGLSVNAYGAVRATGGPGLVDYTVRHHPTVSSDRPPDASDRVVPGNLSDALYGIMRLEGIGGTSPEEIVDAVIRFFERGFAYSLDPTLGGGGMDLADFLLRRRTGHCEYFATATVLLLRAAGVPARYAVGYSVQEYSRLEDCFVVRDRHAHAWALAWIDGVWREVDATPPDWSRIESEAAGWTLMSDLWSWLRFRISWLRWREEARRRLVWLLIPLGLVLIRRFYRDRGGDRRLRKAVETRRVLKIRPGADSDFYRIEAYLAQRWFRRGTGEPLSHWLQRLAPRDPDIQRVLPLLDIHYRGRFHGEGLSDRERAALAAGVDRWLREQRNREAAARPG